MLTDEEIIVRDKFISHINNSLKDVELYVFVNRDGKVVTLPWTNTKFCWRRRCDALNALNREISRISYSLDNDEVKAVRDSLFIENVLKLKKISFTSIVESSLIIDFVSLTKEEIRNKLIDVYGINQLVEKMTELKVNLVRS